MSKNDKKRLFYGLLDSTSIPSNLLKPSYQTENVVNESDDITGDLAKQISHDEYTRLMEILKAAMVETSKWFTANDDSNLIIDLGC